MAEQERVDAYLDTVRRLEPKIAPVDPGAYYASAAISLKRIADALEAELSLHKLPQLHTTARCPTCFGPLFTVGPLLWCPACAARAQASNEGR